MSIDRVNILYPLPDHFPREGERISVETGKTTECYLNSVIRVFLDRFGKSQDFSGF